MKSGLFLIRGLVTASALAMAVAAGAAEKHKHDHSAHKQEEKNTKEHDHEHEHAHTAPHGGTLVLLGDHFAFLELVLNAKSGKLTAYVLDGEGEKSVRVKQPEIELELGPAPGGKETLETTTTVRLEGVTSPLTGEAIGNTSEFSVKSDKLKGVKKFQGVIRSLSVKGSEFEKVSFGFPEGNE